MWLVLEGFRGRVAESGGAGGQTWRCGTADSSCRSAVAVWCGVVCVLVSLFCSESVRRGVAPTRSLSQEEKEIQHSGSAQ